MMSPDEDEKKAVCIIAFQIFDQKCLFIWFNALKLYWKHKNLKETVINRETYFLKNICLHQRKTKLLLQLSKKRHTINFCHFNKLKLSRKITEVLKKKRQAAVNTRCWRAKKQSSQLPSFSLLLLCPESIS